MIRVCSSKFHKGDRVFGEKSPYGDKSQTHGICEDCFKLEMEELEQAGRIKPDWKERFEQFRKEFKNNPRRRRTNVARKKDRATIWGHPRVGDFVLAFDDIFIIRKIIGEDAYLENIASGDIETIYLQTMQPTDIKTWEAE